MKILDVIDQVDDGKARDLVPSAVDTIVIHRVGKDRVTGADLGDDGVTIAKRFVEDPAIARYTGAENPYHFYVGKDGTIWQTLRVFDMGAHARRWNKQAVGVAAIGDFRSEAPSLRQFVSLQWLVTMLGWGLTLDPARVLKRHDELPGGSSDPNKECPGKFLDVDLLRTATSSSSYAVMGWDGVGARLQRAQIRP